MSGCSDRCPRRLRRATAGSPSACMISQSSARLAVFTFLMAALVVAGFLGSSPVVTVPEWSDPPPLGASVVEDRRRPISPTTSRYLAFLSGELDRDTARARELGCAHRGEDPGMVVLALGRQQPGGAQAFGPKGVVRPYPLLADVIVAYADGLAECAGSGWVLVPMTSNYKAYDPDIHGQYGHDWARFTADLQVRVGARSGGAVAVAAGLDLEPGWSSVEVAQAWMGGYRDEAGATLVLVPSADGCPPRGPGGCVNGWSTAIIAEMVWGSGVETVILPQVYSHSGNMARQWAAIAREGVALGLGPSIAGVTSQARACTQVPGDRLCPQLNITWYTALEQLQGELMSDPATEHIVLRYATDIGWEL